MVKGHMIMGNVKPRIIEISNQLLLNVQTSPLKDEKSYLEEHKDSNKLQDKTSKMTLCKVKRKNVTA